MSSEKHYGFDTFAYSFGYVVGWSSRKELSELKGRSIRDLFGEEIDMHKGSHGVAVIDGIFNADIRQVEPVLHQVHPEHGLDPSRRTAAFSRGIMFPDQVDPVIPGDNPIHGFQEFFPLGFSLAVGVFDIA